MKYMNLIDNFDIVVKSNKCRCSSINLINLDFSRLYYCCGFIDKLCSLINPEILINENCVLLYCLTEYLII
jgi:hypothetical protein